MYNVGIGKTGPISETLDVSGNIVSTQDAKINGVIVGLGGGQQSQNTAVGNGALFNTSNSGNSNTAVGYNALRNVLTGTRNTTIGLGTLNNSTGDNNTAVGYQAGQTNSTGSNNTYIGYQADCSVNNLSNSTALGANAVITVSNQIVLGGSTITEVKIPYGDLNITNNCFALSYTTTSDYRIKENVVTIYNNEDFKIDNLRPVTYTNKISGSQDIGLIAHELQEHYPFLVKGEKDGLKNQSINYTGLIPILIKEIKELKERVKTLESNSLL